MYVCVYHVWASNLRAYLCDAFDLKKEHEHVLCNGLLIPILWSFISKMKNSAVVKIYENRHRYRGAQEYMPNLHNPEVVT